MPVLVEEEDIKGALVSAARTGNYTESISIGEVTSVRISVGISRRNWMGIRSLWMSQHAERSRAAQLDSERKAHGLQALRVL